MEKRLFGAVLLLIIVSQEIVVAQPMCKFLSHRFRGKCFIRSYGDCQRTCRWEGFQTGRCVITKCFCMKLCTGRGRTPFGGRWGYGGRTPPFGGGGFGTGGAGAGPGAIVPDRMGVGEGGGGGGGFGTGGAVGGAIVPADKIGGGEGGGEGFGTGDAVGSGAIVPSQ
ncbi:8.4 kDa sulfur-rich protein precursor [Dorcoceras hygrometricum]|nr:8.4 kDa sulfur-rich protein precursor [Dorcoceras hygrometricum]